MDKIILHNLPIELIDQIIENLCPKDRLIILLRLSKSTSEKLELSCWWRKELQIDLGPIQLPYNNIDWQKLYESFRLGWSIPSTLKNIEIKHKTLDATELGNIDNGGLVFFDGYNIIFGDAFKYGLSGQLMIFNIATRETQIVPKHKLKIATWPNEPIITAAYFSNLLIVYSITIGLSSFEINTSVVDIERINLETYPPVDGELQAIYISKDYICFSSSRFLKSKTADKLTIWHRKSNQYRIISRNFLGFYIRGNYIIVDTELSDETIKVTMPSTPTILFNYERELISPYHLNFDIGKIIFPRSKLQFYQRREILRLAHDVTSKRWEHKLLFDITSRYVAFCAQYNLLQDESTIKLHIFDTWYSFLPTNTTDSPNFNIIKLKVPKGLGVIKGGTCNDPYDFISSL